MKCWGPFIFVLMLATNALAAPPSVPSCPSPCAYPVAPLSAETHRSSTEILNPLTRPTPFTPLGCERPFVYGNETYSADTPQAQDAANLKYFIRSVPEANSLLEEYQNNRRKSHVSAFTGTAGILLYFLALPIARKLNKNNPDTLRDVIKYSGAAVAAGGFVYSFMLLRSNENLIPKAVETYNRAKPADPIELKFTVGWSF